MKTLRIYSTSTEHTSSKERIIVYNTLQFEQNENNLKKNRKVLWIHVPDPVKV